MLGRKPLQIGNRVVQPAAEQLFEIIALNARFAWLIDSQGGVGVPELFEEDATYGYLHGGRLVGRRAIEQFYTERRARGARTSRHLFGNPVLTDVGAQEARGITVLTLYACDGPTDATPQPILIADYHDHYIWTAQMGWHYRLRLVEPVFGTPPQLPRVATPVRGRPIANEGAIHNKAE